MLPFRHKYQLLVEAVAAEKSNEWVAPETLATAGVAVLVPGVAAHLLSELKKADTVLPRAAELVYVTVKA